MDSKTKKIRNSNFELLRIVAMFMIVLFHIQLHGSMPQFAEGFFSEPIIYDRLLIIELCRPLGMIGNGLFLMISGFFMGGNYSIDIGKVSKKLLLQMGFAAIVLVIVSFGAITCVNHKLGEIQVVTFYIFNDEWWFFGYYLLVVLVAKLFLNKAFNGLSETKHAGALLAILAITQFEWSGAVLDSLSDGIRTLTVGVFFFALGGYIKMYEPLKKVRAYVLILAPILVCVLRTVSFYSRSLLDIEKYILSGSESGFIIQSISKFKNYEISVVVIVICIFELFKRMKMPNIKLINFFGQASVMVYFMHENVLFQSLYKNIKWLEILEKSFGAYIFECMKWSFIAWGIGLVTYAIYDLIGRNIHRIKFLFVKE